LAALAALAVIGAAGVVVWAAVSGRGSSAGPLGTMSPSPEDVGEASLTPSPPTEILRGPLDEPSWEDFKRRGRLGRAGSGAFGFDGPNVFAAGEPDQTIYVGVASHCAEDATFEVKAVVGDGPEVTVEVTLAGYARELVPVVFSAVDLGAGEVPLELTLSSDGMGPAADTKSETLIGMDLDDPAERETLAEAIAAARVHPDPPDEMVLAVLDKMMAN
jgi:hypothetical protein